MLHCETDSLPHRLSSKPIHNMATQDMMYYSNALDVLADTALLSLEKKSLPAPFVNATPSIPQLLARDSSATLLSTDTESSSQFPVDKWSYENEQGVQESKTLVRPLRQMSDSTLSNASLENVDTSKTGISRYAAYGFRFMARMKDGSVKTSHLASDLADRVKQGPHRDLILVPHEGEMAQLETAWAFYERSLAQGSKPSPSDVLTHLKQQGLDHDYRKEGENAKLLQRNASNFFKRMIEYGNKHADASDRQAAMILCLHLAQAAYPSDSASSSENERLEYVSVDDDKKVRSPRRISASSRKRPHAVVDFSEDEFSDAPMDDEHEAEFDDSMEEDDSDDDFAFGSKSLSPKKKKRSAKPVGPPTPFPPKPTSDSATPSRSVSTSSKPRVKPPRPIQPKVIVKVNPKVASSAEPMAPKPAPLSRPPSSAEIIGTTSSTSKPIKLLGAKGLSRHSPYGTRFSAEMEDGTIRQSFLAGDLNDRVKVKGGRARGELRLILHKPEVEQLECAWAFVVDIEKDRGATPGAAMVLDHLRRKGLDINHRKNGGHLLQKNAGNFFKRVQEFGRRRAMDPNYLKVDPGESSDMVADEDMDTTKSLSSVPDTPIAQTPQTTTCIPHPQVNVLRIPAAFPDPSSNVMPQEQPAVIVVESTRTVVTLPRISTIMESL